MSSERLRPLSDQLGTWVQLPGRGTQRGPWNTSTGSVALVDPSWWRDTSAVLSRPSISSAPAGYRFPRGVIAVAVRWYLRYGLSYRDIEELLAERGIRVDHGTVYRWVQTFTSVFIDAARFARHATGDRWFVDETYVKVAGRWTYLYRAIDQHEQVIDVLISKRRDSRAARAFFTRALTRKSVAGRGHHRPGTGLSVRDRRVGPVRTARS